LKQSVPAAKVTLLVLERRGGQSGTELIAGGTSTVLSTSPHIDAIHVVRRDRLRVLSGFSRFRAEFEIIRFIKRGRFDTVICTFPEDRFAIWAYLSGARVRVGQRSQGLSWLLSRTPDIQKKDSGVLEYYCDLVRAIGAEVKSKQTEYRITTEAERWADGFLRKYELDQTDNVIAVHPGATGDYKIWPPERYAALIDRLNPIGQARVFLTYGEMDTPVVGEIRKHLKKTIPEACAPGIDCLAALLKRSSLCISNDSGPRHLAVAVGTPSLAFFRQHHDREWKVYSDSATCVTLQGGERCPVCPEGVCQDRIVAGERFGSECLRMIGVEEGVERASSIINS
jgi:heptosyltransferase-2